jgi:hypothetical protein
MAAYFFVDVDVKNARASESYKQSAAAPLPNMAAGTSSGAGSTKY